MSITENKPPGKKTRDSDLRKPVVGKAIYRRPVVLVAALVVIALIGGGAVWALKDGDTAAVAKAAPTAPTAPITLPSTIGGLAAGPVKSDFAAQPVWRKRAKAAAENATVVGRGFGSAQTRRQIRVAAGRADLSGTLEFAWAADSGRTITSSLGTAHCTKNLRFTAGSEATVRPTTILCWRATSALSAYGLVIDFDHNPTDADGMAALDATWKAALTGR